MALPSDFLLELKSRNDMESVLSQYINLKRRGSNLVGLCPFHNEKTPSFTVYPENGSYYCFGCGQGGDVITFTMKMENLDYIDAVRKLADRAGMKLPENGMNDREQKEREDILAANREAARFFNSYMMSEKGKAGLQYFLGRGLNIKTVTRFGLGYAPNEWHALCDYMTGKGFTRYILKKADLVAESSTKTGKDGLPVMYDKFRGRAMFPIINIHGKVIGFSGRILPELDDKRSGKYVNTADTPVYKKSHNIFAMNFAKNHCSENIILVEGNMDVAALHQAGFPNTVAALGTSFTDEQARLLSRYTKEVIVTLDADSAGEKATDRALRILNSVGLKARVLRLPECKDPDEYIKLRGPERFKALLEGASNDIEYKLYTAAVGLELETDGGRLEYLHRVCDILADIDDRIAVDLYAGKLADKSGVSKEILKESVLKAAEKRRKKRVSEELDSIMRPTAAAGTVNPEKQKHRRAASAEETVIRVLMLHPDLSEYASENLKPEAFVTEFNRRVYEKLTEIISEGHAFDLVLLGADFTPDEISAVASMQVVGTGNIEPKALLRDSIKVILEEKEAQTVAPPESMDDTAWAEMMRQLQRKKSTKP